MDIVICVALKDCLIAKKTIHYIRKEIEADCIYVITDQKNFGFFRKAFQRKYKVNLINELELLPNREAIKAAANKHFTCAYRFGWYYQQFLKMSFALSNYAKDYYLIWDSDTIPLNKLSFINQGKMVFTPKTEYHQAYFETIKSLMGYQKEASYSFIAEHMIIDVSIMKELIQKIESTLIEGESWPIKTINATPTNDPNGFSEFETYGTYCHHNYANRFMLREIRTFREGGSIYSRGISKRKLNKLSEKHDTISFESWNSPRKFSRRLRNSIEIWFLNTVNRLRPR